MKRAQLVKIKALVSCICAKGCILMPVHVLCLDMTTPPWCREKVCIILLLLFLYLISFLLFKCVSVWENTLA